MQLVIFPFISRSGSTYLFNQLSQHPNIFVCPEAEILMHRLLVHPNLPVAQRQGIADSLVQDSKQDPKLSDWNLSGDVVRKLSQNAGTSFDLFCSLLSTYRDSQKPAAEIILFKGPRKLLQTCASISQESRERYSVKIMSIVRDGRASYSSQKFSIRPATGRPMQVSPLEAAREWSEFVDGFHELADGIYDADACLVRYEDFIDNPDSEMTRLLEFLRLSKDGLAKVAEGDMADRIPESHKALHSNIGKPPIVSRKNAWQRVLNKSEIFWYENVAGSGLQKLGYELENPRINRFIRHASRIVFMLRLWCHKAQVYRTHLRLEGRTAGR